MNQRITLFLLSTIIILQITISLVRVLQVPMWTGYHHELDTYRVVRLTLENQRFPTEEDFLPGEYATRQGTQPPLYTLLALPLVAAYDDGMSLDLPPNPAPYCLASNGSTISYAQDRHYNLPYSGTITAAYALRALGTLLVTGSVVMTYLAGQVLFPRQPMIGLIAAGIIAFEPSHLWLGSTIINDNLLLLIAAANLFFAGRVLRSGGIGKTQDVGMLLVTALLAVFTKLSGWVLFVLTVLILAIKIVQVLREQFTRRHILIAVGVLLVSILLGGLVAGYNTVTIGNPLGRYSNLGKIVWDTLQGFHRFPRTLIPMLAYSAENYTSFLRRATLPGRIIELYQLGTLLVLLTIPAAIIKQMWQRRWLELRAMGWLLLVSLAGVGLVLLRNHIPQTTETFYQNLIYAPLRYYATMTPALVIMMSAGLYSLLPRRFARWHPFGAAAVLSWLGITIMVTAADPNAALLRESNVTPREFMTHTQQPGMNYLDGADPLLLGYTPPTKPQTGRLQVELYAGTAYPLDQNLMGQITLVDANGNETECQFLPARGLYPTTRWEPGEIVRHTQTVHNCTQPLEAPIDVQFQWSAGVHQPNPHLLAVLNEDMGISSACPPNYGVIGDELQVTSIKLPDTMRAGQTLEPYLNYLALQVPLTVETRTFSAVHTETGTTYQCTNLLNIDGRPITFGESRARTARGETIFMDSCAIYIPPDAPPGTYHVYVAFTDAAGTPLSIASADGKSILDHRLIAGSLRVK